MYFKSRDIKITFKILKTSQAQVREALRNFRDYLFSSGGQLLYFDRFKQEGFRGYYIKNETKMEMVRESKSMIEFDMHFKAPNGICFAYDNLGHDSVSVNVVRGYGDVYFSDGASFENVTEDFNRNMTDGFVIICPSTWRGVVILERLNKIIATRTGKIIVNSPNHKLISI